MNAFKRNTYSEQVVDYIKTRILNGSLSPGEPVMEISIASELSISRAPVREAMQILLREGLIESHPQKVKHVTALTSKQIKDSYFTGGILEAAAVAKVLNRYTDKDIDKLESILFQMKDIADKGETLSKLAELDNSFHNVLFSRIDNDLIKNLCRRSCQGISKFLLYKHWLKLFPAMKVYQRHKKIVDALKTRDAFIVEHVIREHYIESGEKMSAFGVDVNQE
ncbi:MAG: GntR family transcriptional regulator [Desulfotignum sp.]|nr:GntR family transcriptional regulator [Desulfotignum sp.]